MLLTQPWSLPLRSTTTRARGNSSSSSSASTPAHAPLERGRADVERQIEIRCGAVEIGEDAAHPAMELAAPIDDDARPREFVEQLFFEHAGTRAQRHAADAALGRRNQQAAE